MSEYYDYECDERLFPDDEIKYTKSEENYFDGLDLGFNFNFLETKDNGPEIDPNFMVNHHDQKSMFDFQKNSEQEVGGQSMFNLKFSPSPTQNGKKMSILNKLRSNFSNPESDIFTKSFLNMLNEKNASFKSQSPTFAETMVINQNINNNYFFNSSSPTYTDDNRYQESQFNNIYKIRKMLADQQIRKIQQVVRKISDTESSDIKSGSKKNLIFKTTKIPKKSSFHIESFSLDSEKSSRKISESTPGSTKKELKKTIKLIRNRLSAQKSRLKKKYYIQKIEKELAATKESLAYYKTLSEVSSPKIGLDSKILELQKKEGEISSFSPKNSSSYEQLLNKKKEYCSMQERVVLDLYKSMVKSITPVDLKIMEKRLINVDSITSISSLDNFLEGLIKNMIE